MTAVYLALLLAIPAWLIYRLIQDPLRKFPGPRLAAWTDLWRTLDVVFGCHDLPSAVWLHGKYGDVVRVAPNVLTFSSPQAIKDIYGTDKPYTKSSYYYVAAASARGNVTPSLFSSLDVNWHDNLKRAVNPAFTLSQLVSYEPFVESTIREFLIQLESRYAGKSGPEGVFALQKWTHWYSFDVIGELTYGAPFGFLKTASDVDGIIAKTNNFLCYTVWAGCMPFIDYVRFKNPILLWLNRQGYFNAKPNPAVAWALKNQNARLEKPQQVHKDGRQDLLIKFMEAKERHPDVVTDKEVLGMGLSMVFAGSESTAVTLAAIFYFLLKNPDAYSKLLREIDENFNNAQDVTFRKAHSMPYLDACVKETFRMHPAGRFTYERVLPPQGAQISGYDIPGGTVVGINAWALHRRKDIFGDEADTFKPERWLPASDSSDEKARIDEMSRTLMQFGSGKFVCIGKNISLLEIYKVVPCLLKTFTFQLDDPTKEWRFEAGSFVNVSGVDVRISKRAL